MHDLGKTNAWHFRIQPPKNYKSAGGNVYTVTLVVMVSPLVRLIFPDSRWSKRSATWTRRSPSASAAPTGGPRERQRATRSRGNMVSSCSSRAHLEHVEQCRNTYDFLFMCICSTLKYREKRERTRNVLLVYMCTRIHM